MNLVIRQSVSRSISSRWQHSSSYRERSSTSSTVGLVFVIMLSPASYLSFQLIIVYNIWFFHQIYNYLLPLIDVLNIIMGVLKLTHQLSGSVKREAVYWRQVAESLPQISELTAQVLLVPDAPRCQETKRHFLNVLKIIAGHCRPWQHCSLHSVLLRRWPTK